jgi:hypothetical protein
MPMPGMVQGEANHQEGAEGGFAQGKRRADSQPLSQIVQSDAQGDQGGQADAALERVLRSGLATAVADGEQHQPGEQSREQRERDALQKRGQRLADLNGLQQHVDQ